MNLNDIKTAWRQYDRRLQTSKALSDKIIISMISERAGSRFANVRRQYLFGFMWMLVCLLFGLATFLGNPFDYALNVQYVPIAIYTVCLIVLLAAMLRSYIGLYHITIGQDNLDSALKKIIAIYERPKKFIRYIIILLLFTQVVLFPLSFLPRNIERMGFWPAVIERLIPIAVSGLLLFIAFRLGAFKDRALPKFKGDLDELEELRSMSKELDHEPDADN